MLTIKFDIVTNVKDTTGFPSALEVCGKAFADHISSKLTDIRDPVTGASVRLEARRVPAGIVLSLHGSDSCVATATTRIHSMLSPELQLGSRSFLFGAGA
jgi:hypothetical protein